MNKEINYHDQDDLSDDSQEVAIVETKIGDEFSPNNEEMSPSPVADELNRP